MAEKRLIHEGANGVAHRVMLVDSDGNAASLGGSGSSVDRETVVSTYRVKTTGTGYSVGDVITATRVLDVSGASASQVGSTVWYNETAGAALAGPPTASHLTLAGMGALTDAELRASAVAVEPLGTPGVARQLAAGAASANTALTTTCRRISMTAVGAAIRYAIGTGAQTAVATSHYIAEGERLDVAVPASAQIAVLRAGSVSGTLEVTELV